MPMFTDISCDRNGNKDECLANAETVKVLARRFGIGQGSIGPGSEKKWYSSENSPQGAWDDIAEQMLLEFAESEHPTFCKEYFSSYRKSRLKGLRKYKNFSMTNVDINSDTKYTINNDTNNHDTRNLHK